MKNRSEILKELTLDSNYYGEFGRQFLSNSDIRSLLKDPKSFQKESTKTVPMVIGGYFHTIICEPDKVDKYKIIDATTRNTKAYKELSNGEVCLLEAEADKIGKMRDDLLANDTVRGLIKGDGVEYEVPGLGLVHGETWKGKADILNHNEKLIIDLKTTADLSKFRSSAYRYNYDSQAYIYQHLFGYEMIFVAIDKTSNQIGIYDCSEKFLESGKQKVINAVAQYQLFFKNPEFDFQNYFISETL